MKVICPKYLICTSNICFHKKPHEHYKSCESNCDNFSITGCIPSLKEIRKDKLKKLKIYDNR